MGISHGFPVMGILRAREHGFHDGLIVAEARGLLQKTDAKAALQGKRPVVRGGLAGENAKQSRFSGSIRADQSDAFAGFDREGEAVEKRTSGKGFTEFMNTEKNGHLESLP